MNARHQVMAQTGTMAAAEGWSRKRLLCHIKRLGGKRDDQNIALKYFYSVVEQDAQEVRR